MSSCAEAGGMLMKDVGWSGGAAAEVPGEGWTECSNTHPCCERGHESFHSAELKSTGQYQSNHLQPSRKHRMWNIL